VAAGNLRAAGSSDELRRDQIDVIGIEVTRLNRLFQNIVDMARIETGAVAAEREWGSGRHRMPSGRCSMHCRATRSNSTWTRPDRRRSIPA
jgi:K+-sensing histidine kinase KdpD